MTARPVFTESANTVANGKTGATSFTTGQLLYGNGAGTLATSANLSYDTNGNLILNGAQSAALTTDKLQVNGNALINGIRFTNSGFTGTGPGLGLLFSGGPEGGGIVFSGGAGSALASGGSVSLNGGNADTTGSGGNATIYTGGGGSISGDSGYLTINIGPVASGGNNSGGSYTFSGVDGSGPFGTGSGYSINLGNSTTADYDGHFTISSGLGGTFDYLPRTDTLTVGNLRFGTWVAAAYAVSNGYITVIDNATGSTIKLMTRA